MSAYVDLQDLKDTYGVGEDFLDDAIEAMIETASDDVNDLCVWAPFDTTGESQTRDFASYTSRAVRIGPIHTVTTVKLDTALDATFATELTTTDYLLEPFNATLDDAPWMWLTLRDNSTVTFPACRPNVRVVGVFGWETVPSKIKTATSILASRYLKRSRDAPFALIPGESAATRIARQDPDVLNLLRRYMRSPNQA